MINAAIHRLKSSKTSYYADEVARIKKRISDLKTNPQVFKDVKKTQLEELKRMLKKAQTELKRHS